MAKRQRETKREKERERERIRERGEIVIQTELLAMKTKLVL